MRRDEQEIILSIPALGQALALPAITISAKSASALVYWSRNRGCVMASANASSNALGSNGLKEAGVWFPPGVVDIGKLIE